MQMRFVRRWIVWLLAAGLWGSGAEAVIRRWGRAARAGALAGMTLVAASSAHAFPIPHEIFFTVTGGSPALVGGFTVDNSLIGPGNPNATIGFPPFLTDFNITFDGSTWATPNLAGPPNGDTTEIILAFTDANGIIDDMFVFMRDDFAPLATGAELVMNQAAFPGGTFTVMSEPVSGTYTILAVPEPSTGFLLGLGLVGLMMGRRQPH